MVLYKSVTLGLKYINIYLYWDLSGVQKHFSYFILKLIGIMPNLKANAKIWYLFWFWTWYRREQNQNYNAISSVTTMELLLMLHSIYQAWTKANALIFTTVIYCPRFNSLTIGILLYFLVHINVFYKTIMLARFLLL